MELEFVGRRDKAAAIIIRNFLDDFIFFLLPFLEIVQIFLFPIFKVGRSSQKDKRDRKLV